MAEVPDLDVVNVKYPSSEDCVYSAVGIARLKLPESDERMQDFCIFSQMPLPDSDEIGAIVYSNSKPGEALVWQFICTDKRTHENAHIFDMDYLKIWIDNKGAEYCHCPVCRKGVTEERKEHMEEAEIDTMEQLVEKRDAAGDDLPLRLFQEQLIMEKACSVKWDRTHNRHRALFNEQKLRETLEHWTRVKKVDEFRPKILDNVKKAIEQDMESVVKIVLDLCNYSSRSLSGMPDRNREIVELINHCCRHQAIDTLAMMTRQYIDVHLEIGIRPECLLFAIKAKNIEMIALIFEFLTNQAKESRFVADECFEASIKFDCIEAAQKILELRWHSPSDEDYSLAERCDNSVNVWLQKRRRPLVRADSNALDWGSWEDGGDGAGDDDDWDDDEDDGFADEPAEEAAVDGEAAPDGDGDAPVEAEAGDEDGW